MTFVWIAISILVLIVWAISVYDIVRRHLGARRTAAWLLLIVILPLVGSVVYWALRPATSEEVEAYAATDRELRDRARRGT